MTRAGCWWTWRSRSLTDTTTISEIAVLGDQAEVFGAVASDSTCWRLLDRIDDRLLARVAAARARAREVVWASTPKRTAGLRYRLLHVAARIVRGGRQLWLRIQRSWPWADALAAAFARLHALPVPAG